MLRIIGEFARRWHLLSALVHDNHILAVRDGGKVDQMVANVLNPPRIVGDRRLRRRVDQVVRPVRLGDHTFEEGRRDLNRVILEGPLATLLRYLRDDSRRDSVLVRRRGIELRRHHDMSGNRFLRAHLDGRLL